MYLFFFPDGILKQFLSIYIYIYPQHTATSLLEDHPSRLHYGNKFCQAAALFKCVAAKAPPPVSGSTQWGRMWPSVVQTGTKNTFVTSPHIPRFQKQNAMGLTFLDVLHLAVSSFLWPLLQVM